MQGTAETDSAVCKTHKKLILLFMQGIAETDSDACMQGTAETDSAVYSTRHIRDFFRCVQGTAETDLAVYKAQQRMTPLYARHNID